MPHRREIKSERNLINMDLFLLISNVGLAFFIMQVLQTIATKRRETTKTHRQLLILKSNMKK